MSTNLSINIKEPRCSSLARRGELQDANRMRRIDLASRDACETRLRCEHIQGVSSDLSPTANRPEIRGDPLFHGVFELSPCPRAPDRARRFLPRM